MSDKIKLCETVMLIDTAFFNRVVVDLKDYFERTLNRSLPDLDLSLLTTYLALDAGIQGEDNKVQLLLVYDNDSSILCHSKPCHLSTELDGVAYSNQFGEFLFTGVPCAEMVSRGELFIDLLNIVCDSADVKRVIVVSYNEEYGEEVTSVLSVLRGKEIVQFRMDEPVVGVLNYRWEVLAFPIMQAFGIKGEEL